MAASDQLSYSSRAYRVDQIMKYQNQGELLVDISWLLIVWYIVILLDERASLFWGEILFLYIIHLYYT